MFQNCMYCKSYAKKSFFKKLKKELYIKVMCTVKVMMRFYISEYVCYNLCTKLYLQVITFQRKKIMEQKSFPTRTRICSWWRAHWLASALVDAEAGKENDTVSKKGNFRVVRNRLLVGFLGRACELAYPFGEASRGISCVYDLWAHMREGVGRHQWRDIGRCSMPPDASKINMCSMPPDASKINRNQKSMEISFSYFFSINGIIVIS